MLRFAAILAAAFLTFAAHATPILYTDSAVASGTLGGVAFTNLLVTVNYLGNTTDVVCTSGVCLNTAGIGYVTFGSSVNILFTDSIQFFVNQTSSPTAAAGIYDITSGSVLDTFSSVFATYDGKSSIGPVTGTAYSDLGHSFGTTAGALILSSVSSTSTFTASTATPEPSSLLLLGTGIVGLAGVARRRLARS